MRRLLVGVALVVTLTACGAAPAGGHYASVTSAPTDPQATVKQDVYTWCDHSNRVYVAHRYYSDSVSAVPNDPSCKGKE